VRAGDQQAFVLLVTRHHSAMPRLARSFVSSTAVAEEVVQDTWLGVLRGLDGFAGRSSFTTWLLQILVNRARSTGVREQRSVAIADAGPAVDRSRFDASGAWMSPPQHWIEDSDDRLLAEGLAQRIQETLNELPPRQREVMLLRDVDGLSGDEVCQVLDISEPTSGCCCTVGAAACARPWSWNWEGAEDAAASKRSGLPADGRVDHRLSRRRPAAVSAAALRGAPGGLRALH
jgi:RNA polymerase sigma-70 factor (ECF subfamily)